MAKSKKKKQKFSDRFFGGGEKDVSTNPRPITSAGQFKENDATASVSSIESAQGKAQEAEKNRREVDLPAEEVEHEEQPFKPLVADENESESIVETAEANDVPSQIDPEDAPTSEAQQIAREARAEADDARAEAERLKAEAEETTLDLERIRREAEEKEKNLEQLREQHISTANEVKTELEKISTSADAEDESNVNELIAEIINDDDLTSQLARIAALRQAAEDRLSVARQEQERNTTLRRMLDAHRQRLESQLDKVSSLHGNLEEQRQGIDRLRHDIQRIRDVMKAEGERVSVDLAEAERAKITAQELEKRAREDATQSDIDRKQVAADKDRLRVEKEQLQIRSRELEQQMHDVHRREQRINSMESQIDERLDNAEQQRKTTLANLEEIDKLQTAAGKTKKAAERQLRLLEEERKKITEMQEDAERQRLEAEQFLAQARQQQAINESEAELLADAESRIESERSKAAEKTRTAEDKANQAEEKIEANTAKIHELENQLSAAEAEKIPLNSEIEKLRGDLRGRESEQAELTRLRAELSAREIEENKISQLEETIEKLQQSGDSESDRHAANIALRDLGQVIDNLPEDADPDKINQFQQNLSDLLLVASGGENIVQALITRSQDLADDLLNTKQSDNQLPPPGE